MDNKNTLTIKDWLGTGTGELKLDIASYMLIERNFGSTKIQKLVVNRKPDRYSSRFGMMANLNKNNRTLSWGFTEMTLTIIRTSDQGGFLYHRVYVFTSIGVEKSQMVGNEEEITFVFNQKGEFCIGQC